MRHAIANGLYSLAGAIDTHRARLRDMDSPMEFGDEKKYETYDGDSVGMNFHTRPDTQITANFKPGEHYTYAALTLGTRYGVTVFLNRRTTRRMIDVLKGLEGAYARFGENRPS